MNNETTLQRVETALYHLYDGRTEEAKRILRDILGE